MSGATIERLGARGRSKNAPNRPLTQRRALKHPENKEVIPRVSLRKARSVFLQQGSENFQSSQELADLYAEMTKAREEGHTLEEFQEDLARNFAMHPSNRLGTSMGSETSDLDEFIFIVNEAAAEAWTKKLVFYDP